MLGHVGGGVWIGCLDGDVMNLDNLKAISYAILEALLICASVLGLSWFILFMIKITHGMFQ